MRGDKDGFFRKKKKGDKKNGVREIEKERRRE